MQRRSLLAAGSLLAAAGAASTSERAAANSNIVTTTTKLQPTIFELGAKGYGATDDSPASNAAISSAASKGQVILVPSFTYVIAKPIVWTSTGDIGQPWGLLGMGATLLSKITSGAD